MKEWERVKQAHLAHTHTHAHAHAHALPTFVTTAMMVMGSVQPPSGGAGHSMADHVLWRVESS